MSFLIGTCLGVGAYFTLLVYSPQYTSEIIFEIRPGLSDATEIGTQEKIDAKAVDRVAKTQAKFIVGRDVLETAIWIQLSRSTQWLTSSYIDPVSNQPMVDTAVDDLQETLSTPIYKDTNLFSLKWSAATPTDVPKVLDAIAKTYGVKLKRLDDRQFSDNESPVRGSAACRTRRSRSPGRDPGFIVSKGITTLDDPRFSQTATEVDNLTQSLTRAQRSDEPCVDRSTCRRQPSWKTIEPTSDDVVEAENDPTVQSQIRLLEAYRAEERSLRERFHSTSNQILQIEASIRRNTAADRGQTDELSSGI